jgi:protein-L-isoaspartate(D-aspartate) O-methyltransferase
MTNFDAARHNMVESQIRTNKVTDNRVIAALRTVPRELFVPAARRSLAYIDEPLPIGSGRALPSPMIAARLYQAAAVNATDLVLVVGAGSGYGAAVLGRIASAVVALEQDADLLAMARNVFEGGPDGDGPNDQVSGDNVILAEGPLTKGWAKQAPYDVIAVEGAMETIPAALLDQLAPDGRLVCVMRHADLPGQATIIRKSGSSVASTPMFDAMLPLLPGFDRVLEFAL